MGMTIDEAIQRYKNNAEYERTHGNLQGCLEFSQLAKWLEELRAYRNMYHADNVDNCLREKAQEEGMTIDDSERYLRLMLGGMKYAVKYWEDRDKEESDIEQTNVEAVKTALDTMHKYQLMQADYENRLKADMVAMLTDIQLEIEEKKFLESSCSFMDKTEEKNYAVYTDDISNIIQQKINSLKAESEDKEQTDGSNNN